MRAEDPRVWGRKLFVNADNQVESVELVEDSKNPDGLLSVQRYQEVSPPPPGTHRPFGRKVRLPDELKPVRIKPTGEILPGEPTVEVVDDIIGMWSDYSPFIELYPFGRPLTADEVRLIEEG